jgi:hypothetical protein
MKGLAIASMVLGIVGLVFTLTFCGAFTGLVMAIVGVTLGGVAIGQYNNAESQDGRGMATAGVVLSVISIVLALIFIMLIFCGAMADSW